LDLSPVKERKRKRTGEGPAKPQELRDHVRGSGYEANPCPKARRQGRSTTAPQQQQDIRGLGIPELRPRRARTGALLLEVPGADGGTKAGALAEKLRVALGDREGVTVSRPVKTAEMRVKDLEDSISAAEVAEALAAQGGCAIEDVRVGPIRPGSE